MKREAHGKNCNRVMKTDMYTIAEIENLEVIETTSGMNGYPRNLKEALIGFDSFEQAERVANKHGLSIEIFEKRDGWQLYSRTGRTAYEEIKVSAEEYGDDYSSFISSDLEEFYENEVKPMIAEFESFEQVEDFLEKKKKICEAIEDLDENEIVITYRGEYFDTVHQTTMSFSYDSKTTVIGLIDRNDEEDDD